MIYLVRHGESTANISKRFCGITDVELSDAGKIQAIEAALNLKGEYITNIYSSPLIRAYETAKVISEQININVKTVDCLREVNFGIFENMTWDEMLNSYKDETDNWIKLGYDYKFPEGESYGDIIDRIADFIENIEDNSVIVSHFGIIQGILLCLHIADPSSIWNYHISNCDIIAINNKKIEKIIKCNKSNSI